jgi:type III secretion protein T
MIDLSGAVQQWFALIALYAVRPMVMLGLLPATDEPMLTLTARFQLGLAIAAFSALGGSVEAMQAMSWPNFLGLILRESVLGAVMALAAGKVFWVAQALGAYVDNLAGYNNVQLINPSSSQESTPLADVLFQLCTAMFYAIGGILLLFNALVQSWQWWPVQAGAGGLVTGTTWPDWQVQQITGGMDSFMSLIASVASPLLLLFTIVDLALGLLSRFSKGVDTSAIATPVKAGIALLSLALFASVFLDDIKVGLTMDSLLAQMNSWRGKP